MNATRRRCAMVMAGGTGGHIFPGLAVAQALRAQGWQVHWLGNPQGMEAALVTQNDFAFEAVDFGGVRGKGLLPWLKLPWRLLRGSVQALRALRRVKPEVVFGMGGYITVPGGLAAVLLGRTLILHEQNSRAGLANRVLALLADRVYTAFPQVLSRGIWIGNPLRTAFTQQADPAQRFAQRSGRLHIVVVGGSLGAQALNDIVPAALALLPEDQRPSVLHQSGPKHLAQLQQAYAQAGVQAQTLAFIDEPAQAYADADLVIARAGASTVTELAAVGAAALFVPYPHATDDHQSSNAAFLVDQQAAWLMPQSALSAASLSAWLASLSRAQLLATAQRARTLARCDATASLVAACMEVVA